MTIKVMIASDIRLYREGLELILARRDGLCVVGTAAQARELVTQARRLGPDVVLLDLATQNSRPALRELRVTLPDIEVVALTVPALENELLELAEAGIASFVSREGSVDDLVESVYASRRGELSCSPRVAGRLVRRVHQLAAVRPANDPAACLTRRERDVLAKIEMGWSNKEIARSCFISVATVKNHVHNLLAKLRVQRRGEAAALFRQNRQEGEVCPDQHPAR